MKDKTQDGRLMSYSQFIDALEELCIGGMVPKGGDLWRAVNIAFTLVVDGQGRGLLDYYAKADEVEKLIERGQL